MRRQWPLGWNCINAAISNGLVRLSPWEVFFKKKKANWNKRKSLLMWYMEDKKSKHEIFYFSPEPLFWFYLTNTWFFSYFQHFAGIRRKHVLASLLSDHSQIVFFTRIKKGYDTSGERSLEAWQFFNCKCWICSSLCKQHNQYQFTSEFLEYEIRKFTIQFSKNLIKEKNKDF